MEKISLSIGIFIFEFYYFDKYKGLAIQKN
ncbi:hypothetical protein C7437_101581 [Psychrobacillus insolitus]|uniref:Uncharacterized protein n=1 Tax=Psychrobacillus insolitus TaxID=1461 RepID=A0A2W7MQR8_9BACI|nr:hypothetical protein C7437_101581 [Psychrobacillus insolitus]